LTACGGGGKGPKREVNRKGPEIQIKGSLPKVSERVKKKDGPIKKKNEDRCRNRGDSARLGLEEAVGRQRNAAEKRQQIPANEKGAEKNQAKVAMLHDKETERRKRVVDY